MCKWFKNKEASAATRGAVEVISRSTKQGVVRWGAIKKFSRSRRWFYPSFDEAEKVRVVSVDDIGESSRMDRMENRTNIEGADSEIRRAWVEFIVTREKKKGKEKMTVRVE